MTSVNTYRDKSPDELADELNKLRKERFNLRFQAASGQLEKTSRVRVVRRDIARVQTVLEQKQRESDTGDKKVAPKKVVAKKVTPKKAAKSRAKAKEVGEV